jgi:flagellar biogenesis protein FliO
VVCGLWFLITKLEALLCLVVILVWLVPKFDVYCVLSGFL